MVLSASSVCRDYDRQAAVQSILVTPYKPTSGAPSKRAGRGEGRGGRAEQGTTHHSHAHTPSRCRSPSLRIPDPYASNALDAHALSNSVVLENSDREPAQGFSNVKDSHPCLWVALVWGQRYWGLRCSHVTRYKLSLSLSEISVATLPGTNLSFCHP